MRAVGHVIMNRAKAWANGDVVKVITAPLQFSSMTDKEDVNTILYPSFSNLFALAEAIYDGQDPDLTGGALYYDNPSIATSSWFAKNIAGDPAKHPLLATIGHQNFYG